MPPSTRPPDCVHARVVPDGDDQRCTMCGTSMPRYTSAAAAIAACRERLRITKPVEPDEEEDEVS
jgi:hypothetical protein